MINGLLIVDKEKDMTSRDVVNEISRIFQTKKVGHTGTLDPLATGVLVLAIGKATKLNEIISSFEKCVFSSLKTLPVISKVSVLSPKIAST